MSTIRLISARVIVNKEIAPDHFILGIKSQDIARSSRPGQFAHINCGKGIILRRPLSFYKIEGENVFFLYKVVGKGTASLKMYSIGEDISILGPLGRGFWFNNNGRKKIIIAGGVGIAPFPFLIKEMIATADIPPQDIVLIYGAVKKNRLIGIEEFESMGISLRLCTDSGEEGVKCTVPELLLTFLKERTSEARDFFACGPEIMMKKVTEIIKERGGRVQVSLEERMGCGVGVCLSCVRYIAGNYMRICKDGPVFWGDEVKWQD